MQPVVNSPQYRGIEARFAQPMRDVLITLLSRHTREHAAELLGINPNTLDRYLSANGLVAERFKANVVKVLGTGAVVALPAQAVQAAILAAAK